ncbi:MAG: regulatory protein SipA [Nodosilinea sp.]
MAAQFSVGDRVRLVALPSYLKTAEPMPMLKPATLLAIGDQGVVLDRRPGDYWGVRFGLGAFLIDGQFLEKLTDSQSL